MAQLPFIARFMPISPPHRVEILTFPDANLLDITGPAQVFATVNELHGGPALYDIAIVGGERDIRTSAGIVLQAGPLPDEGAARCGTLLVAGGFGVNQAAQNAALLAWIRRRAGEAARTASVCSGAFLLAETGLLDGRRAVTHWQRCAEFAGRFPAVRLEPDPIFVQDGSVWTSAGITAGIDLALAMVEADHGHALALAAARQLVVFLKRPGGQSQFSAALALQGAEPVFDRLHGWIAENLRHDLSLDRLADQAGMSLRTFSRRYRRSTGRTPAEGVELLRVEQARRLLEEGLSVTRASAQCGFGATETMRRAFLRHIGVGPQAYRERFQPSTTSAAAPLPTPPRQAPG